MKESSLYICMRGLRGLAFLPFSSFFVYIFLFVWIGEHVYTGFFVNGRTDTELGWCICSGWEIEFERRAAEDCR